MHPYRMTVFIITCGLVLGGLASPAAAKTIIVTTNLDVVDSPFNADGLCGSGGTVANLPGADGKVSLREAIIAANNTPGQKTIKFNLIPSDRTIVLTRSLALCGGHTTLNGDMNGDQLPDITLDGRAVLFPSDVFDIFSSHNTVKSLEVLAPGTPGVGGLSIGPTPAVSTTLTDNTLTHNIVTGGSIFVFTGFDFSNPDQPFDGGTIKHAIVRDNTVSQAPGVGIQAGFWGAHHEITDVTIAGNTVSGNTLGILAHGGGSTESTDNRLEVTIKDNLVTGNSNPGDTAGIAIVGGLGSSSHNQVTAEVLHNTITDNEGRGIGANAGIFGDSDNQVDVTVKDNTITGNSLPNDTVGIAVLGGFASSGNHLTAALLKNTITSNNGNGITVGSGGNNSSDNDVAVTIRDNTLENNAGAGIVTFGAFGTLSAPSGDSSGNSLDARIEHNTVTNAFVFGIFVYGGLGGLDGALDKVANANEVTAVVKDNTVTGTTGEGINLSAGASGVANDNDVDVTVRKNTVCGSSNADIHAIGGLLGNPFLPDNLGTGNELEGEITKNTASIVVVEDGAQNGLPENTATVTQSKNAPCP